MSDQWVLTRQELKDLMPHDGDDIGVFENNSIYTFSLSSTEPDDNNNYISPNISAGGVIGRWIKTKTFSPVNHVHTSMYSQYEIDNKVVMLPVLRHEHDALYKKITDISVILRDSVPLSILPNFEINMPATPRVAYMATLATPPTAGQTGIWCDTEGVLWFWDGTVNKKIKLT